MKRTSISFILSLTTALSLPVFAQTTIEENGAMFEVNKRSPGARVDLSTVLSKEKPTLLFVHSEHCGPCKRIAPKIKQLAQTKSDIRVAELMLDGEMEKGIGWESPAAKQFNIHSVPAYFIYDRSGKLTSSGKAAKEQVFGWMASLGIAPAVSPWTGR